MLLSNYLVISEFKGSSSSWSAHRTRSEFDSQFDAIKSVKEGRPVLLTGEVWKKSAYIGLPEKSCLSKDRCAIFILLLRRLSLCLYRID